MLRAYHLADLATGKAKRLLRRVQVATKRDGLPEVVRLNVARKDCARRAAKALRDDEEVLRRNRKRDAGRGVLDVRVGTPAVDALAHCTEYRRFLLSL